MIHIGPAGRKADNADNNGASLLRTIVVAFPPARPAQGIRESAKLSQSADPMALSCGLFLFSRSVGEKKENVMVGNIVGNSEESVKEFSTN